MAGLTAYDIMMGLMTGKIDSVKLEDMLTTDSSLYLGPFRSLIKSLEFRAIMKSSAGLAAMFNSGTAYNEIMNAAGSVFAGDSTAVGILVANSGSLASMVTDSGSLDYYAKNPDRRALLNTFINKEGSCLVRYHLTSGYSTLSNWSCPDGDLVEMSIVLIGGGGAGGKRGSYVQDAWTTIASGGQGGGGGEVKAINDPTLLMSSLWSVHITNGGTTQFFSFSAAEGQAGHTEGQASGNGSGGGSNSGTFYDRSVMDAFFQTTTASIKGGNGGAGESANNEFPAQSGQSGIMGPGGEPTKAPPNTAMGSGGGGGGWHDVTNGQTAEHYLGNGSGGGGNSGGGPTFGRVIIYGVLDAPIAS